VTSIETAGGRMIVHEGDESLEVPLTTGWTVAGRSLATSAARLDDGRLVVDLAFLTNPHRLEIELDPGAGTFVARWPLVPLFGAGPDRRLASMHPPAD